MAYYSDEALSPPPPYTEAPFLPPPVLSQSHAGIARSIIPHLSYPLTAHLHSLPARLHAAHQARASVQLDRDLDTIPCLLSPIESFLMRVISSSSSHFSAELTLVPAGAAPDGWALSGADQRRRDGEMVAVVRVRTPPGWGAAGDRKAAEDKRTAVTAAVASTAPLKGQAGGMTWGGDFFEENSGRLSVVGSAAGGRGSEKLADGRDGFDEWGRFEDGPDDSSKNSKDDNHDDGDGDAQGSAQSSWWWRDEDMARRLAGYLQPEQAADSWGAAADGAAKAAGRRGQEEKAEAAAAKPRSRSLFGVGRSWGRRVAGDRGQARQGEGGYGGSGSDGGMSDDIVRAATAAKAQQRDGAVNMKVRGEEVTFRRENQFGVWESLTGFGIVVTVTVRA